MDPITGVLIGGGIALVSNVLTQLWTSRREAARHQREEAARRDRELRAAYAEWLSANQRAMVLLTAYQILPEEKRDHDAFVSKFTAEIATVGSKLRILEDKQDARVKVTESLDVLSMFAVKLATSRNDDPMAMFREIDATARKLGELERWVLSTRFPPEKGQLPAAAPESLLAPTVAR